MNKIILIISFAAFLLESGCESKIEVEEKDKYLVTSPLKKDTVFTKEYVCQIRAIQHIEIRAVERGYLQDIYVDEGNFIKKGKLMFQIMPLIYKAEFQKAQAEANYAQIEYENTKQLSDKNVVSPNELALMKAKLEKAKAELALTQVHLSFTEIRAPFDGIINRFQVRQGSLLEDGDMISTLSNNSKMWVYFNVPEAEYLDYFTKAKNGGLLKVNLMMANNQLFEYQGVVETIEADFNNQTGNIAFRATFPNPKSLLRHGETGNILVVTPIKNALIIPQKATFEILDKKYVYVIDKDNAVKARKITIGAELQDLYAVTEGLTEKDKILLEGLRKVKESDVISFEYEDPQQVISHLNIHAE
jgi:membrane fusion protein, multidrug efflux system